MNFERLEKNLIDNIKEAQLKIGYSGNPMSLNYMQSSLEHLTGVTCDEDVLSEFAGYSAPRLGELTFRRIKNGFCITVSAEGTAYVNSITEGYGFLTELVSAVSRHGISLDDILGIFRKYSENVIVEDGNKEDFDLLVYFADQSPDEYLYCLTAEPCMGGGCHIIYHRFIREDFEDIGF